MIVVAKDTEEKLLQELKQCRAANSSQRCFYIALSKIETSKKELYESFLITLHELPNSYMAQVFICSDKDVFILMAGFMQRHFEEFLKKFAKAVGNPAIEKSGYVFEVGRHWAKLENLCVTKIALAQKKASVLTESQIKEKAAQIAQATIGIVGVPRVLRGLKPTVSRGCHRRMNFQIPT